MRVRVAPVLGHAEARSPSSRLRAHRGRRHRLVEAGQQRDALLQSLMESGRAALANIRASIENLVEYTDMKPERRAQFTGIIRDEAVKLSERLDAVTREFSEVVKAEYSVEEMRAKTSSRRRARIESRSGSDQLETIDRTSGSRSTASRSRRGSAISPLASGGLRHPEVRIRLGVSGRTRSSISCGGRAALGGDCVHWENDPLHLGGEPSPLTLKNVLERHGGEAGTARPAAAECYYRLVLPLASARPARGSRLRSRAGRSTTTSTSSGSCLRTGRWRRALAELTFTVFDTETTGLDPRRRRDHFHRRGAHRQWTACSQANPSRARGSEAGAIGRVHRCARHHA